MPHLNINKVLSLDEPGSDPTPMQTHYHQKWIFYSLSTTKVRLDQHNAYIHDNPVPRIVERCSTRILLLHLVYPMNVYLLSVFQLLILAPLPPSPTLVKAKWKHTTPKPNTSTDPLDTLWSVCLQGTMKSRIPLIDWT